MGLGVSPSLHPCRMPVAFHCQLNRPDAPKGCGLGTKVTYPSLHRATSLSPPLSRPFTADSSLGLYHVFPEQSPKSQLRTEAGRVT